MAQTIFFNGALLTQEAARPRAQALAVDRSRIVAVGSREDVERLTRPGTRHVDLGGRALVPGFNDAHAHLWRLGQILTTTVDLRKVDSIAGLRLALADARARRPAAAWLLGRGWNEMLLREGRAPDRRDLDGAAKDLPVFVLRACAHVGVANSRALQQAGIDRNTVSPPGGVIERGEDGEPTGILRDTAMDLVQQKVPPPSGAEIEELIRAASRHQLERGITSSSDAGVTPRVLAAYRRMDEQEALLQRVNVMALRRGNCERMLLPLPERHVSDRLRVDTVKLWADGGLSAETAALHDSYRDGKGRGLLRIQEGELTELACEAAAAGLRLATHAIGDAAIDLVLSAYEAVPGTEGLPRRIEHFALPDERQLARAARLGVVVVPQPIFVRSLGVNLRCCLPDALLERTYPVRAMLDAGLIVALSSDAPMTREDDPLLGIQAAVLRRDEEGKPIAGGQALSVAEALRAYTMGGALASGDADNRGSLRAGKRADLAVLSANPLEVEPEALDELRVDMTYVDGELAYER